MKESPVAFGKMTGIGGHFLRSQGKGGRGERPAKGRRKKRVPKGEMNGEM